MSVGPGIFTYSLNYLKTWSTEILGKKIIITNLEAKISRYLSSFKNIQCLHENTVVNENKLTH